MAGYTPAISWPTGSPRDTRGDPQAFEALVISVYDTDKAKAGGGVRKAGPAGNVRLQPQNQAQQKKGCCGGGGNK